MADRDALLALAERVEGLLDPSEDIEQETAIRIYGAFYEGVPRGVPTQDGLLFPRYTASLDAAMSLVPEGWDFRVERFGEHEACSLCWPRHRFDDAEACNEATTPALALTAAALRARAAAIGSGEGA